ncbi:MAG: pirin family protein [Candidatus Kariarchaeaceae archaeon]|jgi:redox-sensitive bicupin YhaK (pirin superfamily)
MNNESQRSVKLVTPSVPAMDGAGVRLKRAFGNLQNINLDPFLLLDQMYSDDPKEFAAGFPWHPHRGIETVTYIIDGEAEHEDSLGNKGIINGGEIQWMTAGSGIIHQEMPRPENKGLLHGFQLWVNLPSSHKMMQPRYQDIKRGEIPEIQIDKSIKAKVLAGSFNGMSGPVQDIITEPSYLDLSMESETRFSHDTVFDHTVIAYMLDGTAYFDPAHKVEKDNLVVFNPGEKLEIRTDDSHARFLLMSGKPIKETVAWYGPVVMNTRDELIKAFEEINNGTFIKHEYKV